MSSTRKSYLCAARPSCLQGRRATRLSLFAVLFVHIVSANLPAAKAAPSPNRPVPVELFVAKEKDMTLTQEYIGHVEAVQAVELRPQVSAVIEKVEFLEGSEVKEGQLLFSLDRKSFSAAAELRRAELAQAQADRDRAQRLLKRMEAADKRSVTASALDDARCAVLDARAKVRRATAALSMAEIDLERTKICSPIDGRIGAALVTRGNYVTSATPLARVVQTDPIRVSFALSDREYLAGRAFFAGGAKGAGTFSVRAVLPGGAELSGQGRPDFIDNRMNPGTGAILARCRFDNPDGLLVPGELVTLRVLRSAGPVLIVPQETVVSDRQGDFVWFVDDGGIVSRRSVVVGQTADGLAEIVEGLAPGDRIVRRGMQRVRHGSAVTATAPAEER